MAKPKRTKLGREAQERVSAKIAHLVKAEGKTPKQAAGEAYAEERAGRLRKGGKYVRAGEKR